MTGVCQPSLRNWMCYQCKLNNLSGPRSASPFVRIFPPFRPVIDWSFRPNVLSVPTSGNGVRASGFVAVWNIWPNHLDLLVFNAYSLKTAKWGKHLGLINTFNLFPTLTVVLLSNIYLSRRLIRDSLKNPHNGKTNISRTIHRMLSGGVWANDTTRLATMWKGLWLGSPKWSFNSKI